MVLRLAQINITEKVSSLTIFLLLVFKGSSNGRTKQYLEKNATIFSPFLLSKVMNCILGQFCEKLPNQLYLKPHNFCFIKKLKKAGTIL